MWQTYSVLSKIKKPRISQEEFLNYYHIKESEIRKYDLQEFMDFFEITRDDLHMKSKEEVLFALWGFYMDQEAERATCEELNFLAIRDISKAEFKCISGLRKVHGKVDFTNHRLEHCNETRSFSPLDRPVLLQALRDLGLMKGMSMNEGQPADEIWEFEMTGENGVKRQTKAEICHPEVFLQIIETILVSGQS